MDVCGSQGHQPGRRPLVDLGLIGQGIQRTKYDAEAIQGPMDASEELENGPPCFHVRCGYYGLQFGKQAASQGVV
jgi:hypothetical protein